MFTKNIGTVSLLTANSLRRRKELSLFCLFIEPALLKSCICDQIIHIVECGVKEGSKITQHSHFFYCFLNSPFFFPLLPCLQVTDQSVQAVAENCPELQFVGFMGCPVTSQGVIHLTAVSAKQFI